MVTCCWDGTQLKKKQTTFFCLKPENKKSSATRCHFTLIWRSQYAGLVLQFLRFLPGTNSGCSNRTLGPEQLIFLCFFMEGKKLLLCRMAKLSVKHPQWTSLVLRGRDHTCPVPDSFSAPRFLDSHFFTFFHSFATRNPPACCPEHCILAYLSDRPAAACGCSTTPRYGKL